MDNNMKNLAENILSLLGNEGVTIKAFENGKPIVDIENGVNKLNESLKNPSLEGDPNYVKIHKECLTSQGIKEFDCPETKNKNFCFIPKNIFERICDDKVADANIDIDKNITKYPSTEEINGLAKELVRELLGVEAAEESTEEYNAPIEPKNEQETEEEEVLSEVEFGPREQFTDITPNIYKDDFDETYFIRHSVAGNRIFDESILSFDFTAEDGITTPGVTDADILMILMYRNRDNEKVFNLLKDALVNL